MPDSVGVQREAREVAIKAGAARLAIGAWGANDTQRTVMAREVWDAGVAALAEAGYEVVETVRGTDPDSPFRRVEGGATGEQT